MRAWNNLPRNFSLNFRNAANIPLIIILCIPFHADNRSTSRKRSLRYGTDGVVKKEGKIGKRGEGDDEQS